MLKPFPIESFKYGLDSRRDVLTSVVGTLYQCDNAYINPGGEVEKRPAFSPHANLNILDSNGAVGSFGLEVTEDGVTTFGSALVFGSTVTQGQPTLVSDFPAPVGVTIVYQQLRHPTLVNDSTENYDATKHRMTQLIYSENFNGKAFAIAKFADGRRFLYFDGSLVQQSANGIVMSPRNTLADIANDLKRQIEDLGWRADANLDENDVVQNGSVIIKSPPSDYFDGIPEETATNGQMGIKFILKDDLGTPAVRAYAGFQVVDNTSTFALHIEQDATATVLISDLTGGAVAAAASVTASASAIAQAVNDLTFVHGYSALAQGDLVFVFAPIDGDVVAPGLDLVVTFDGAGDAISTATTPTGIDAYIEPRFPLGELDWTTLTPVTMAGVEVTGIATCQVFGGTAPSFSWAAVPNGLGGDLANGLSIVGAADRQTCTFRFIFVPFFQPGQTVTFFPAGTRLSPLGQFQCTVNSGGNAAVAIVSVQLRLNVFAP